MEGLELKHYLDAFKYKVPCRLSRTGLFNLDLEYPDHRYNEIGVITDLSTYNDGKEISGSIKLKSGVSVDFGFLLGEEPEIELIYRQLSDLTKEIEHNCEKFIPEKVLFKLFGDMTQYQILDKGFYSLNYGYYLKITQIPYNIVEKLLEWHFAIDIPEELYININNIS